MCLSGLPYWCTDIGGFSTDDRFTPELYIRWLQWGVFCPLFRTHGTRPENEAWSYGEQAEKILRRFIDLRYQLTPYIYSCARKITETGKPMMRALCLDFPDDEQACLQKYEYMFGPAFLVAPILEKNARSREVYLPHGIWYNYYTNERLEGGRTIMAQAPLDRIPLYVREGSIIPMMERCQYIGEKSEDKITVHIYGQLPSSFVLYEDDGETYGYEKGVYAKTLLSFDGKELTASVVEGDASVIPHGRIYESVVHPFAARDVLEEPSFDCDWDVDGISRVHMTMDVGNNVTGIHYQVQTPSGWRLTDAPCYFRKTPLAKGEKMGCGVIHMMWEFTPVREFLTVCPTADFTVTISGKDGEKVIHKKIGWGSGCVARANVIGFFSEENSQEAAVMKRIEAGDFQPFYTLACSYENNAAKSVDDGELSAGGTQDEDSGQAVFWNRYVSNNCFGYLDLRPMAARGMKNGKGCGYARFLIWSPKEEECRFEFSAERYFAFWANGEKIFEMTGMQPKQIPEKTFQLHKGYNVILVKNFVDYPEQRSGREIGFSFKLLTMEGKEIPELLYGI